MAKHMLRVEPRYRSTVNGYYYVTFRCENCRKHVRIDVDTLVAVLTNSSKVLFGYNFSPWYECKGVSL